MQLLSQLGFLSLSLILFKLDFVVNKDSLLKSSQGYRLSLGFHSPTSGVSLWVNSDLGSNLSSDIIHKQFSLSCESSPKDSSLKAQIAVVQQYSSFARERRQSLHWSGEGHIREPTLESPAAESRISSSLLLRRWLWHKNMCLYTAGNLA